MANRTDKKKAARPTRRFSLARLFGRDRIERSVAEVSRQFTRLTTGRPPSPRSELHRCLQQALDSMPGLRKRLVHLAYLESRLSRMGDDALAVLPADLLAKASNQLAILMRVCPPSRGLTHLASRIGQSLEHKGEGSGAGPGVGVSDASLDDYDQAVRDSDLAALATE